MKSARPFLVQVVSFVSISTILLFVAGCGGKTATPVPLSNPPQAAANFIYVTLNTTSDVAVLQLSSSGVLTASGSPISAPVAPAGIVHNAQFTFLGTSFPLSGPPFPPSFPIVTYTQNEQTGALSEVGSLGTSGTGGMTVDPAGHFLYAGTVDGISVFSIGADGSLTEIAGSPFDFDSFIPGGPLMFHPSGQFLFAWRDSGGGPATDPFVSVAAVDPQTGVLSSTFGSIPTRIPGGPATEGYALTPDGKFLLNFTSNALLPGQLCSYTFDPSTGAVGRVSDGTLTATSCAATGAFPMAITSDPSGAFVLVTSQPSTVNGSISVFSFSGGILTEIPGSPFPAGNLPALITFSADGKFVIVGDQGSDFPLGQDITNDLMVFTFDSSTGALGPATGPRFQLGGVPEAIMVR